MTYKVKARQIIIKKQKENESFLNVTSQENSEEKIESGI